MPSGRHFFVQSPVTSFCQFYDHLIHRHFGACCYFFDHGDNDDDYDHDESFELCDNEMNASFVMKYLTAIYKFHQFIEFNTKSVQNARVMPAKYKTLCVNVNVSMNLMVIVFAYVPNKGFSQNEFVSILLNVCWKMTS